MSLKDDLLATIAKPQLTPYTFNGVPCYIKAWSELELLDYTLQSKGDDEPNEEGVARTLVYGLYDEAGQRIFDISDAPQLLSFPHVELKNAFEAIIAVESKGS